MRDKVIKALSDFSLIESGDRIVVALSGGADSVALLHMLYSLKEEYNLTLYACHINHMIRGAEADDDEQFVRDLCDTLNIELFVKKVDVLQISKSEKISLELCGRNVRYAYFKELCSQLSAKVATAHTSSDNVETVLYNIARGTSVSGLCGISAKRDYIIRPLIYCCRKDVEDYCASNDLQFVTDSTNLTDDYTRNNIRHNAVPVLRQINPYVESAVHRMCASVSELKAFVDKYSQKELKLCKTEHGYSCEKLNKLDKAILDNAIYLVCKENGVEATCRHIELIRKALSSCGCVDLGDGKRAVCKQSVFRITDVSKNVDSVECKFKDYPEKEYISVEEIKNINKNLLKNYINCDIITDKTVIRTRREGDMFTFSDRKVTKSVKKLFNELKIPAEKRSSVLLVANDSTVLWIQGVGASEDGMITDTCKGVYKIFGGNYD